MTTLTDETQTTSLAETISASQVPSIRTELPGPAAREVLARDGAITSPSLPRAYPLAPGAPWAPWSRTSTATCSSTSTPASR